MTETVRAGPVVATGTSPRNTDLAVSSEHIRLDALRVQYLSEVFGLPADTAVTIAALAFGEASHAS
jgi:hypothetical protein